MATMSIEKVKNKKILELFGEIILDFENSPFSKREEI